FPEAPGGLVARPFLAALEKVDEILDLGEPRWRQRLELLEQGLLSLGIHGRGPLIEILSLFPVAITTSAELRMSSRRSLSSRAMVPIDTFSGATSRKPRNPPPSTRRLSRPPACRSR